MHDKVSFEAEGTVTYKATWPNTSYTLTKHFIVTRNDKLWKIRTIFKTQEYTGNQFPSGATNLDLYWEMGFDGTNLYTLEQQDTNKVIPTMPPQVLRSGNYVCAEGRVEKAVSPPYMDNELLCPVWLAYCSAPYLSDLKDDRAVSPFFAARDFLSEPIQHLQLPAKWELNDKFFVKDVSWFSDGKEEDFTPNGRVVFEKIRKPYDGPFLHGHFENLSWTNWNGMLLPSSFKLVVYRPSYQETPNEKPTFVIAYTMAGTLDAIRKIEKFSPVPELTMKTHITDSRVMRGGHPVPYASTNLWDYSAAIP